MPAPAKSKRTSKRTSKRRPRAKAKKAPKPSTPATEITVAPSDEAARVDQVLKWLLKGATENDIRQAIVENFSGADAGALIAAALTKLDEEGHFDPVRVRGFCFSAAHQMYAEMVEIADYSGALRALKFIEAMTRTDVHDGE